MKILFSGGGTLGPVTPLLALKEIFDSELNEMQYVWVGTKHGPENDLLKSENIKMYRIQSAKLRRYFSLQTILTPFRFCVALCQSVYIIFKEDPDVCISAGGFVSVPVHIAAWLSGTPTWVHQQDIKVGLANKIMSPLSRLITTSTENLVNKFKSNKVVCLGNPVRMEIVHGSKVEAVKKFGLNDSLPTVLAMGGGTGSTRVNQLVVQSVPELEKLCNVIHVTGKERPQELSQRMSEKFSNYKFVDFLTDEFADVLAASDIVITRGGFGSLTELAALRKPAIIIPKPGQQQKNVSFVVQGGGATMLDEVSTSGHQLAYVIKKLLLDSEEREQLGERLHKILPLADKAKVIKFLRSIVN